MEDTRLLSLKALLLMAYVTRTVVNFIAVSIDFFLISISHLSLSRVLMRGVPV